MNLFIYGLKNPLSGNIFYIGKSSNVSRRYSEHLSNCTQNFRKKWIIKTIKEHGLKPELIIFEEVSKDNWKEREKFYILKYIETVTNTSMGGDSPPLNTKSKKVCQFDLKGTLLKTWKSSKEIARKYNLSPKSIRAQCVSNALFKKKYILMYEEDFLENGFKEHISYTKNCGIRYLYTVRDKYNNINNFNSVREIKAFTKESEKTITRKLKNGEVSKQGFFYSKERV